MSELNPKEQLWPHLPLDAWQDTCSTYSYTYPEPEGFKEYPVKPEEAYYFHDWGEFVLPYEAVRTAEMPDEKLLAFLQSTYEAAATLSKWDRGSLDRK